MLLSVKAFNSTGRFLLWPLCRNFDTKFWNNFVSESKIDETSQFLSKKNDAYPENVPQEKSNTILETLSESFFVDF